MVSRHIHACRCACIHPHTANKTEFIFIPNTKLKKNPFIILRLTKNSLKFLIVADQLFKISYPVIG